MAAADKFDSTIVTVDYEELIVRILMSSGEVVWGGIAPSCSKLSMQLLLTLNTPVSTFL